AHVWTKINRPGRSAPHLRPASFGGASEHYHHLVDDIALRCHRPTAGGTEPERVHNSFIRCAANTRRGRRSATSLPRLGSTKERDRLSATPKNLLWQDERDWNWTGGAHRVAGISDSILEPKHAGGTAAIRGHESRSGQGRRAGAIHPGQLLRLWHGGEPGSGQSREMAPQSRRTRPGTSPIATRL